MVVLLVAMTVVIALSVKLIMEGAEHKRAIVPAHASATLPSGQLFVHNGHTWARLDSSGEAKVGIDHFLLKILGGADRLSLPASGSSVSQGERVFSVYRGGKKIGLVSPIEGVVSSINQRADLNAEAVRKDPYKDGWLFTIKPKNLAQSLRNVRSIDDASGWFESEVKRFSTFLVSDSTRLAGVGATSQDGGQYPGGIIEHMDEEQLRAFESRFLG
jgi:glycine cleavage system H lipoate-binding protein